MKRLSILSIFAFVFLGIAVMQAIAQTGNKANNSQGSQGSQSGQGSGSGMPGLSFTPAEWPALKLPDVLGPAATFKDGRFVVCYRLEPGNSATQPYVLEPIRKSEIASSGFYRPCGSDGLADTDSIGQRTCKRLNDAANRKSAHGDIEPTHWSPCSELGERSPSLLMNQILVVGVDLTDIGIAGLNSDQIKLLNINVTSQQGAALNPSPVRASFPGSSPSSGGGGGSAPGSPGEASDTSGSGRGGFMSVGAPRLGRRQILGRS